MGTRTKRTENLPDVSDIEPIENLPVTTRQPAPEDDYEPEDIAIMQMLSELGTDSEATVRVYRQGKMGHRDLTYLFECPPDEFSPTLLQEEPYNGGEFRIHARSKNGIIANRAIKVAPRPSNKPTQDQALQPMQAQISSLTSAVEALLKQATAVPVASVPSRHDLIQELLVMRDIFTPANQVQVPQQDPFIMMRSMLELSKDLGLVRGGSGEGGEPSTLDVLMKAMDVFGKPLAEGLARVQQQAPQRPAVAVPVTNSVPVARSAPIPLPGAAPGPEQLKYLPDTENQEEQNVEFLIRRFVKQLCDQAAIDTDPTPWGMIIVDQLPEEKVRELINDPDWLKKLAAYDARVQQYAGWFEELKQIIPDLLTPDTESGKSPDNDIQSGSSASNVPATDSDKSNPA